jgi:hypothetical protein
MIWLLKCQRGCHPQRHGVLEVWEGGFQMCDFLLELYPERGDNDERALACVIIKAGQAPHETLQHVTETTLFKRITDS